MEVVHILVKALNQNGANMPFPLHVTFGNLILRFEGYESPLIGNLWTWKLDAFRTSNEQEADVQIVSNIRKNAERTDDTLVLSSAITGFFERVVLAGEDGGTDWIFRKKSTKEEYIRYHVNPQWNRIELQKDINVEPAVAFEYLAQMMPGIALKHNYITFHAALMEYDGAGIAILAPSGVGKTTHARLWRDVKRAWILNGDRAVCKKTEQGWIAYGTPWSGSSGEQINRQVPLKAMVILEQAPVNKAFQCKGLESFTVLLPHLLYPEWDKEMGERAMDGLTGILEDVPVFRLQCRPDAEAVETLYQAIKDVL